MKHYKYIFTDLDGTLYNMYPEPFSVLYKDNFYRFLESKNYDSILADYVIQGFAEMRKSDGVRTSAELLYDFMASISNYNQSEVILIL